MVKKSCSPYDQVMPLAGKGEPFKPGTSLGSSWQSVVVPGGDNYFQEVGQKQLCWEKPWRPQTCNQVEKLACVDLGNFDIRILLNRKENVSAFRADAALAAALGQSSLGKLKDALGEFSSAKAPTDSLVLSGSVELWPLQEIFKTSALRSLDSVLLSLYIKASDEGLRYLDSFWVFGTKSAEEAMKLIVACTLKAEQQIELLEGLSFQSLPVVLKLDLPLEDVARLSDMAKLSAGKAVSSSLRFGDICFVGVGFALQGYGEGAYGL